MWEIVNEIVPELEAIAVESFSEGSVSGTGKGLIVGGIAAGAAAAGILLYLITPDMPPMDPKAPGAGRGSYDPSPQDFNGDPIAKAAPQGTNAGDSVEAGPREKRKKTEELPVVPRLTHGPREPREDLPTEPGEGRKH